VDEMQLCILWNEIQSMNDACNKLFASNRRQMLPFVNMTQLEWEIIDAMDQAYHAILPCCFPAQDCNEAAIIANASQIGSYQTQLESIGFVTPLFEGNYTIEEARHAYLDANCGNPGPTTAPTTLGPCCPEFVGFPKCHDLCDVLTEAGLEFGRRADSSKPDLEDEVLSTLKDALVIIENCVEFSRLCNASHAKEVAAKLRFFHNNSAELSPYSLEVATNLTNAIEREAEKAREGLKPTPCPAWIYELKLDDTLAGSLCLIFTHGQDRHLQRRQRREDCSPLGEDFIEDLECIIHGPGPCRSTEQDIFLRALAMHEQDCISSADLERITFLFDE
jgi:hypothetical protein